METTKKFFTFDVSTSIGGLHQKKLGLLMKASDRGRNVKSKELFVCFDEIFITVSHC